MDLDYWKNRWAKGETAFHLPGVHPKLERFWPLLELPASARVLVPLCGKTADLLFLSDLGHDVIGVEASELAARAFFAEKDLPVQAQECGAFLHLASGKIAILVGDFFALDAATTGPIDAIYDRAALVALPEALRKRYAGILSALAVPQLLITLIYQQQDMPGPPFSVPEEEIAALYPGRMMEPLCDHEIIELEPRFKARGLRSLRECAYLIQRSVSLG